MTDKVQKIKEVVEKRYEYWREKESNSHSIESEIRMSECQHLLLMLDSLQEELKTEWLQELQEKLDSLSKEDFKKVWAKYSRYGGEEPASDDLEEEIDRAHRIFYDEVGWDSDEGARAYVADWSAHYFANWQKEQFEKNRLKHCDSITNEQAELEQGFIDQHLDNYKRMPTYLDAIEYGMRLQKEQMMKNACKFLDNHLTDYWAQINANDTEGFLNDFRKTLED